MADTVWRIPYTAQRIQDALTNASPRIGTSGKWETYDISTGTWVDTGVRAAVHDAYIGANTHWYQWDNTTNQYVDTNVVAGYEAYDGSVTEVT